jgi:hypothetical protein
MNSRRFFFADDFERKYEDPEEKGKYFNTFFTQISSLSVSSGNDCDDHIDKTFSRLKREKKIRLKAERFKFVHTNSNIVEKLIFKLKPYQWSRPFRNSCKSNQIYF